MKIAPISIVLLLCCAVLWSCRETKSAEKSTPATEATPSSQKKEVKESPDNSIPDPPPSRAVKKKKQIARDSLLPKRA